MDKLRVFISDDSATVRERLVTMALDLPEVDVVGQAQNAPGTLDGIRQTQPDVVILDIRMPGGSGIEVLRKLKEMTPAPAVIMLTNFAYVQYRSRCGEVGADFFFDKSTEFDRVPQALEQVRQGLRADLPHTSDPLAQAPDAPIPAEAGVTSAAGQNAAGRRCSERPHKWRVAYWKETRGLQDEPGHTGIRWPDKRGQGPLESDRIRALPGRILGSEHPGARVVPTQRTRGYQILKRERAND
jgi:DNA-binding NarL/FixJ family response regulator